MENTQKIKKPIPLPFDRARLYFELISVMNDLRLTDRESEFMAWLYLSPDDKDDYVDKCRSSYGQYYQLSRILKKKGVIVETKEGIAVHPALLKLNLLEPFTINLLVE